jgi:flagellar motor switch/type III secretory pathway protein FliN
MNPPFPLRRQLKAIDDSRAERQTQLIAAINRRRMGDLSIRSRVAGERDRLAATAWIRFSTPEAPLWVAPLLVDGDIARLSAHGRGPDAAAAAASLGPLEPLIQSLERAFGREMHPDGVDAAPAGETVMLRVDALPNGGAVQHRVVVAAPHGLVLDGDPPPPETPPALAAMRFPIMVRIAGPALPAARFGTIAAGDLMLLGSRPLLAHTVLPGQSNRRVDIDAQQGSLTVREEVPETGAGELPRVAAADGADGAAELRVPVTIEVDGGTLTTAEAAVLAPGSVLNLPEGSGTLTVRVVAGGAAIGRGELVAVGQGYGVLFTSIAGSDEQD